MLQTIMADLAKQFEDGREVFKDLPLQLKDQLFEEVED
jgi:hypothetical protein